MNFSKLQNYITQWAEQREILTKSTPKKQLIKTHEEINELLMALEDDNKEELKDAIGDIAITLIIYAKMKGYYINYFEGEHPTIQNCTELSLLTNYNDLYYEEQLNAHGSTYFEENLVSATFLTLETIANNHQLSFFDCIKSAYLVIKNRKGKIIKGQFVKNQ